MSTLPVWQQISGLTPEAQRNMSDDQRDDAVALLVAELEKISRIQFSRAKDRPSGERSVFYDPLDRACREMEISRVKLSSYCKELTGLRAGEITDRVKATLSLTQDLSAYLQTLFQETVAMCLRGEMIMKSGKTYETGRWVAFCSEQVRELRAGPLAQQFAGKLGYANISRLRKACVLAHNMSLEQLEAELLTPLVQKFLDDWLDAEEAAKKQKGPSELDEAAYRRRRESMARDLGLIEKELSSEDQAAIDDLLKEGAA